MKKILFLTIVLLLISMTVFAASSRDLTCVKIIEVPQDKLLQCEQLISGFAKKAHFSYSICYNDRPMFVLVGNKTTLAQLSALLSDLSVKPVHKDLIFITASLQDAVIGDGSALGVHINDIPIGAWWQSGNTAKTTWAFQIGDFYRAFGNVKFRANDGDSKIVVAGQVVTTNGLPGIMRSTEQIPYSSLNTNGYSEVKYNPAETIIKITPTIVEYNENQPELSKIQLVVDMQISAINSLSSLTASSSPEVTKRKVTTSRIVNADSGDNIVAAMMRDEDIKIEQGVPILNQIPLLKYLFSQETTARTHVLSLLKVSVQFVEQADAGDELLINVNPAATDYQEKTP
ncbi:MAG: hypothetical protein WCV63_07475 [Negativicutes bacterium]|jgi:type II secretory pathway component GspD/PulD (secretin)